MSKDECITLEYMLLLHFLFLCVCWHQSSFIFPLPNISVLHINDTRTELLQQSLGPTPNQLLMPKI